jgi:hypothetical protein
MNLSVIGDRLAKSGVKDFLLKNFISELASQVFFMIGARL